MSDNKHLPPTLHRLAKARQEGQVGISNDLCKVVRFGVIAEATFAFEETWRRLIQESFAASILSMREPGVSQIQVAWSAWLAAVPMLVGAPLAAALLMWLMTVVQTRLNFAPGALSKGASKLNPAAGLQQLLSVQKLLPLITGPVKLLILAGTCYPYFATVVSDLAQLHVLSGWQGWHFAVSRVHELERTALKALVLLAVFDIGIQRYIYLRRLRMSHDEVKRESKDVHGDQKMKRALRDFGKELVQSSTFSALPKPDAIVVNPDHIAIGLSFDKSWATPPIIVARTTGIDAICLRESAALTNTPIIKYVGLARRLVTTGRVGSPVPSQTLRAVALIFRAVQEIQVDPERPGRVRERVFELDPELQEAMLTSTVAR